LDPPDGATLVALRGARLRYRVDSDLPKAQSWISGRVRDAFQTSLGFPAAAAIAKR
jgi:hypothetical protein